MVRYDPKKIEKKWQKRWEESGIFEPKADRSKKKVMLTVPVPYPDGFIHLGHLYTWSRADVYARFMRMRGYNVLWPQGFHMTGGPIVGMSQRLHDGDAKMISILKSQEVSDSDIKKFGEDAGYLGDYFIKSFERDFRETGMSIAWNRKFITTSLNPHFSAFIRWQFNRLRAMGLISQGSHQVVWCPRENTPLGDHDRLSGEGVSPTLFSIIKFKSENLIFPAATLRPETLPGATNIWINPRSNYIELVLDSGEHWVVSEEALKKLENQLFGIKSSTALDAAQLIGHEVISPLDGRKLPVIAGDFVDPDVGTGIVMSVPMHAPLDFHALEELKKKGGKYASINGIKIIDVKGEENLVKDSLKKFGTSKDGLAEATHLVYKKEFAQGVMNENAGPFKGMAAKAARDSAIDLLKKIGAYSSLYELMDEVICRCNARGVVKLLENQWFIRYSDKEWKAKARRLIERMKIFPDEVRLQLLNTLDWVEDKAAARQGGLGTPLPWDDKWLIEPLSDSTIYMAYYTIAHLIKRLEPSELTDDVFDYIFLISNNKPKIHSAVIDEMRQEFEYWYPLDMRISAKELVQNHFLFFIMNHAVLFDERFWPKAIGINGWLRIQGQKMSKSKGNAMTIKKSLETYGADQLRLLAAAGNGMDDEEWSTLNISGFNQRIDFVMSVIEILDGFDGGSSMLDKYLLSRLAQLSINTAESYESIRYRDAVFSAFFEASKELKFYLEAGGKNRETISTFIKTFLKLNHPVFPHVTEELNSIFDKNLMEEGGWPELSAGDVDVPTESAIRTVMNTIADIRNIIASTGKNPKSIDIVVPRADMFDLYNKVVEAAGKTKNPVEIRKELKVSGKLVDFMLRNPAKIPSERLDAKSVREAFITLSPWVSTLFKCEIKVLEDSKEEKAFPQRPAVRMLYA